MKLYFSKGACSIAVRIIIHEIGLNSEFESVDLKTKKTASGKDFLTINPKGYVPVIQTDDNKILTENAVIQQYLADTHQATQLLPPIGDFNRYRVLEWLNYVSAELHKSCGALFNPTFPQDLKENIFKPLLKNKLTYVDNQIQKNRYLLGEQFTLPDAYLFVILSWNRIFKIDLSDLPNLTRYFDELKNRKSIQQALKEEELSI